MRKDIGGETRALVGHVQLDVPVRSGTDDTDRTAPMAQCIVDQVRECLLEAEAVAGKPPVGSGVVDERPLRRLGAPLEPADDGAEQPARIDAFDAELELAVGRTGSRSPGLSAETAAARRRIESTWRNERPASR